MDFRKKFLVDSHVKFKLSNIDPAYKGAHPPTVARGHKMYRAGDKYAGGNLPPR